MSMSSRTAIEYDIDLLKGDISKISAEDESSKVM